MNPVSSELNSLMNSQVALMANWKWVALAIALVAGVLLKSILKTTVGHIKQWPIIRSNQTVFIQKFLMTDIELPLSWIGACTFWVLSIEGIELHPMLDKYLTLMVKLGFAIFIILLVYKAVEALGEMLVDYAHRTSNPLDDQLAPMATKVLKILVLVFGVLISLDNFGIKVTPMLAGLGLGSLAFALAAQDTAANLFGSVTIVADRPFQIGDWIKVGDTEGNVEDIGFRSTRIRTFYNSLVTIPNSIMAKEKIDNMGARKSLRIRHTLGFTYDTKPNQLRHFMSLMEEYLETHPKIQKENYIVKFVAMGDFNLQILVNFFAEVPAGEEERELQQEFLFFTMELAEKLQLEFAFPTATHYVKAQIPQKNFDI